MKFGQQMKSGPARGVSRSDGTRQVVVRMYEDQFEEIRNRAVVEQTSLAEQIRNLLEWGLEAAEQSETKQ